VQYYCDVPQTVLLLDDDAQFRSSVTPALEAFGLRVMHATKGSIARALIEEEEPSVLVVDGLLPDVNGIVWIEDLRRSGYQTPIIFVSAFYRDLATFKHLTHDLDVLRVFHKPVMVERFARDVASAISAPMSLTPADRHTVEEPPEAVVFPDEPSEPQRVQDAESYLSLLPIAADNLTGAIRRVHTEAARTSAVADALRQAHDLHGAAETHGFTEISVAAARIEDQLRELQRSGRLDWPTLFESIDEVRTHAAAAAGQPAESLKPIAAAPPSVTPAASFFLHRAVPRDFVPTILVLEDDPAMIAYLRSAFDEVLVHLRPVGTVEEALKIAGRSPPTATIIGWPLEDRTALQRFLGMFKKLPACSEAPVILLSVEDDPHTRALAAQLGVDIFLPHPIGLVRLHHAVQTAVERATTPRPKVAVLRDSDAAKQIEEAGIECFLYFSLDELLREVDVQCPEVVLIGSTVTGAQVPAIIQMSSWDAASAILCFGDSPVANSPVITEHLNRDGGWLVELHRVAERIACMRRQQLRCSQTGLLLRTAAVVGLENGLSSAQRHGRTYSIGLIGPLGLDALDQMQARRLRTHLGRMISGHFRREDVRGRWDENAFVVGLDGASARAVVEVVRRLQEELAVQRERRPDELSLLHVAVGLASYPLDGDTTRALILAAHERLETALERGPESLVWR
jgi:DNA-binding response OmpR family regulator/GGDEF domain-containing protein/HPt (histidine-containing phosphotransfer) domain-containing protein